MKEDITNKNRLRYRRTIRTKSKISGTSNKPRLAIFRSLRNISVQAIDDTTGTTLASVSVGKLKGTKKEKAREIGRQIAKALLDKKITEVVYDKRHYKYHGLVKELADGAREEGLKF